MIDRETEKEREIERDRVGDRERGIEKRYYKKQTLLLNCLMLRFWIASAV